MDLGTWNSLVRHTNFGTSDVSLRLANALKVFQATFTSYYRSSGKFQTKKLLANLFPIAQVML